MAPVFRNSDTAGASAGGGQTRRVDPPGRGHHAPNNVAKSSLIPDSVISRSRLRPKYGHGWQPRLDPDPRQAGGRALGEEEST